MNEFDAAEIAYQNGYKQGVKDLAERVKAEVQKSINQYWSTDGGGYYLAEDVIPDIDQIAKEMGVE